MQYRALGRTGWNVSEMGFGSWAIGGDAWGATDDREAIAALHRAIEQGVNYIDTADVYGDGHSEQLVARCASRTASVSSLLQKRVADSIRMSRRATIART